MTMRKKLLITIACLSVILCTLITGTIAWLTDKTEPVKNTFSPSNIDVELSETKGGTDKNFKMVPGAEIEKDPKVNVAANSEACYVFVQVTESDNLNTFIEYTMASGWEKLGSVPGVYYRKVDASTSAQTFPVLKDNVVTVKKSVKKSDMESLTEQSKYPTLSFAAYAIQSEHLEYGNATTELEKAQVAWNTLNAGN